jgi:hypothetical protein
MAGMRDECEHCTLREHMPEIVNTLRNELMQAWICDERARSILQ